MKLKVWLARIKRRFTKKNYWSDRSKPSYWFAKVFDGRSATIVQIGSNDGKTGDPLYPLILKNEKWEALFVEPVPYSFEKLKANYGKEDRFTFENVAINEGASMPFYFVDQKAKDEISDLPFWYDQLGSFDRSHIVDELDGKLEPYILEKQVEGVSLEHLLSRNSISVIDILHIDTEGYDWKILSQLDLRSFHPTFILVEINHLQNNERKDMLAFLVKDYELYEQGIDILAVSRRLESTIGKEIASKMISFTL